MHVVSEVAAGAVDGLPRPLTRWLAPLWALVIATLWWVTFHVAVLDAASERAAELPRDLLRLGITISVLFKVLGTTAETSFYSAWWSRRGLRLPYGALWTWLFSLSMLDMLAVLVPLIAADAPRIVRVAVAVVCGPRAVAPDDVLVSSPLLVVFGPLGVLTLARIAMTAWLQARAAGRRLAGTLALTAAVWLALRVATWWLSDLMRGQSAGLAG